jgi:Zn-dependent alcohol dehydrogenase
LDRQLAASGIDVAAARQSGQYVALEAGELLQQILANGWPQPDLFRITCDPKRDIPAFLNLWRAGKLDLEGLITQTSKLDDVNGAFEDMEAGKVIRTVLVP